MEPHEEIKARRWQHWHLKDRDKQAPAEESDLKPVTPMQSGHAEDSVKKARKDYEL